MWGKENSLTLFWVLIGATIMDYQIQTSLQIKNKVSRESINPTSEYFSEIWNQCVIYVFAQEGNIISLLAKAYQDLIDKTSFESQLVGHIFSMWIIWFANMLRNIFFRMKIKPYGRILPFFFFGRRQLNQVIAQLFYKLLEQKIWSKQLCEEKSDFGI